MNNIYKEHNLLNLIIYVNSQDKSLVRVYKK